MKKFFLVAAVLVAACSPKNEGFVIKAEIKGADKGSVICMDASNNPVDTVDMVSGRFTVTGKLDAPQEVMLFVNDEKGDYLLYTKALIFNENISFTADAADKNGKNRRYEGSVYCAENQEYEEYIKSLPEYKEMNDMSVEIQKAYMDGDKLRVNEMEGERNALVMRLVKKIVSFKENGPESHVAAYQVCNYIGGMGIAEKEEALAMFSEDFISSYYLNRLKADITAEKRVAIGSQAPDFRLKDLSGKEYTLADFKGKYVYMDFSASWCGWCKKEIPFIREAYHKFKDRNIIFVTMNMDDSRDKWEGDVKAENIEWLCLSDCKGIKSDFGKSYNIGGIPAIFILDPDGKIINKDVRQNELVPYLESILK